MAHLLLLCMICFISMQRIGTTNLIITVLSQSNKYHEMLAEKLRDDIETQAATFKLELPVIYLTHKDLPHIGAWAVTPIIPYLVERHRDDNVLWFVFVEDRTHINFETLHKTLQKHDSSKDVWLGYALRDNEPTIIHHFAFYENPGKFMYPNTASGFAISNSLMKSLAARLQSGTLNSDFTIDYGFELALFIWHDSKGSTLTHEPAFCISKSQNCCTFPEAFNPCNEILSNDTIYFAVKTCEKFHTTRIPVVKQTWGLHTSYIGFFSDVEDHSIPTISLGIPNTEQGHCTKTFKIMQHIAKSIKKLPSIRWMTIADDDTILSVRRLHELLTCYNASTPLALGERYGYNIQNAKGYNYITGGGGIVLSRPLLEMIAKTEACECPSLSSPDDMFLGMCLARLGIEITHSPLFHQARPVDYPSEYLQHQHVVSFHKHWMIDPINVYNKWFTGVPKHIEL